MKKSLFLIGLLSVALMASAQNLTGKWKATTVDEDMEAISTIDLKSDGVAAISMYVTMAMELDEGIIATMWVRVSAPATWTRSADEVTLVVDKKGDITTKSDIDVTGISESDAKTVKFLFSGLVRTMKKECAKELRGQTLTLVVSTVDGRTVLVETDDNPQTFYRQ